ncbi:MAG: hypothetical protein RL693_2736 [Verrucomicrobiota bacterium]
MNPHDTPDITAYALGELNPDEAAKVRQLMAKSPEARAEYDSIQQTIGVLKKAPAFPKRSLNPRQRETVLTMGQPIARPGKIIPFPASTTKSSNPIWQVAKIAAAVAVTSGAFYIGQKTASQKAVVSITEEQPETETAFVETTIPQNPSTPMATEPAMTMQNLITQEQPALISSSESNLIAKEIVEVKSDTPVSPVAAASAPKSEDSAVPLVAAVKPAVAASPSLKSFSLTSNAQESVIAVHPKMIRPEPVVFAGVVLSSPAPLKAKPDAPRKPELQPALIVHSWKAEIASCPWDSSRRLMRFVAQIPVDQAAVESNETDYNLSVKFDPAMVQGYRLVTEKHMQPSKGGTQATRFAWYEIIPTKAFNASANKPVTLGTLDIVQPRGSNFPSSGPLKLVDRGQGWNDAREDFVFETAMVGFSLLLQGSENIGGLNHKLVLDLAEKTKGEDPKGERAKFIQVVKQARQVIGL